MPRASLPADRLGQPVAGNLLSARLRHQIFLLLRLGAPGQQRQAVQSGVHRQDDAEGGIDVLELFAGHPEARCSPCRCRHSAAGYRCPAARATPSAAAHPDRRCADDRARGCEEPPRGSPTRARTARAAGAPLPGRNSACGQTSNATTLAREHCWPTTPFAPSRRCLARAADSPPHCRPRRQSPDDRNC